MPASGGLRERGRARMRVVYAGRGGGGGTGLRLCKRVVGMVARDRGCASRWTQMALVFAPRVITQLASGAPGGHRLLHNRNLVPTAPCGSFTLRSSRPQRPDFTLNVRTWPVQKGHGHGLPGTGARTTWDFLEPRPSRDPQRTSAIVHSTQNPAPMRLPKRCLAPTPRDPCPAHASNMPADRKNPVDRSRTAVRRGRSKTP